MNFRHYLMVVAGIWLVLNSAFAQSARIDNLMEAVSKAPVDSTRYKMYGDICWYYLFPPNLNLDSARAYADRIQDLGRSLNDEGGQAYSHFYYGTIARRKADYHIGLDHFQEFTDYYVRKGDSTKVAHALFQMASLHTELGQYETAIQILYRALRIHELEEDPSNANFVLNGIGIILKRTGRFAEAIEAYQKILDTDSMNSDASLNMGNVYMEMNKPLKAEKQYRKSLKLDLQNGDSLAASYTLENLGSLCITRGELDSALTYHQLALDIRNRYPNKRLQALSLSQMGYLYMARKEYQRALDYLKRAEEMQAQLNTLELRKDILSYTSKVYAAMGSFKEAYHYQNLTNQVKDSLVNEETNRTINEIRTQYETEKKDQQVKSLTQEKAIKEQEVSRQATLKWAFIICTTLIAFFSGVMIYLFRQKLKNQQLVAQKDQKLKEAYYRQEVSELKMEALRAQINPHFIFNCMNSINRLILEEDTEQASYYLAKFSKLIRMILENSDQSSVTLQDEIALLEGYIQLESLRFSEKMEYHIEMDESINPDAVYLPSMILQPFVENAIWHGLMHKNDEEMGIIDIHVREYEGKLYCTIQDNGIGRERARALQEQSVLKNKSMGLKITRERLKLWSSEKWESLVNIVDLKNSLNEGIGTRVEISLPLNHL